MKARIFSLLTLALMICTVASGAKKVHTIGDSTQEQRATDGSTDKRGWTQMLQQFIDASQFTVNNRGKSGASSKSFYKENGYWNTLVTGGRDQMSSGDILIIQFAHNDEKTGGADGDEVNAYYQAKGLSTTVDYRGTTPYGTYKEYLRKYINEAKAMGVKPILVGAICRKYFKDNNNTKINAAGQHNLWQKYNYIDTEKNTYVENYTGKTTDDHTMDYTYQMAQVAAEYDDVPFVNLTQGTKELYEALGEDYCTQYVFCKDDGTHPALVGATLIARKFAQMVKDQAESESSAKKKAVLEELAAAVQISNEMNFTPSTLDLGDAYIGTYAKGEINISAFGLTPSTGTVTVTADNDFEVSTNDNTYAATAEFSYSGATLISTIYVRKKIGSVGEQTCTITVTDGTNQKAIDVKVNGLSVSTGTEASVVWPLTSSIAPNESLFSNSEETLTGLVVKNYTTVGTETMQRITPTNTAWPGNEIDEVSTRYVEFKTTVPAGKTFYMDNISFHVAGHYASDFGIHAYYATNSSFTDATLIAEKTKMTGNEVIPVSKDVTKTVEEGETIYIRIYPWKETAAESGKYFCLSAMTIHGIMANKTSDAATFGIGREFKSENVFEDGLEKVIGTAPTGITFEQCSTVFPNTSTTQTLKHGAATPTYTGGTVIRNYFNGAGVQNAFVDGFYWGFKVSIPDGYFMSVSQIYSDVYGVKNTLTSKFIVKASLDGTNLYESDTHAANVENGGTACQYTLDASNVSVLQELTGDVYFLMPWYSGSSATYYALKDFNITATLTQDVPTTKYELTTTVSPAGAGKILTSPESTSYKEGTEVTLTTTRNFGYKFKEWQLNGTPVSTEASYKVTMDAAKAVTAVFETIPTYTITTKVNNDAEMSIGSITLTPNEHNNTYEEGEEVVATANTSKILKFLNWEDNSTANPRSITINKNMTITANFEVQDFIAVFDASIVQGYDYSGSPFAADLTWDTSRNAKSCVVKVSDGSLLYTQTGGTPVVRNRIGVVTTGLNGLYQNGYNTTEIAWQYQFSTKGFTSATFSGQMCAKNGAAKSYKAQYSIDGTTFTDIEGATLSPEASKITDYVFDLPTACVNQETVYIRITGTGTEIFNSGYTFNKGTFLGLNYTDHSESGIGNLYILGTAEVTPDTDAPVLSTSLPASGATGISASGKITLSYNERIQAGNVDGNALLNGKKLTPTWNTRSVVFDYAGLDYGQTYTFSMPAGYVADRSGNAAPAVEITFTVMERQQPAARTFDAIVDATLELDHGQSIAATTNMPKQYRYLQDAINDAPSANTKPYLIFMKEGYYADPNPYFNAGYGFVYKDQTEGSTSKETIQIQGNGKSADGTITYDDCKVVSVNKPNIHIIGQDVNKVTIATDRQDGGDTKNRTQPWYHVNAGAALEVQQGANDFYMENITIDNENWTKQHKAGPQALCINADADRVTWNNMNIRSYQDDFYSHGEKNRYFWNDSRIEGAVDFIYGGGDIWFENTIIDINRDNGGYIVAPDHSLNTRWGYVFNNTKIISTLYGDNCQVWLGRPWHNYPKTVFLNTEMDIKPYGQYWAEQMGGLPALWAVKNIVDKNGIAMTEESRLTYKAEGPDGTFAEGTYNTKTATGKTNDQGQPLYTYTKDAKNSLTDAEAAQYTIANVLAGDGTSNSESGIWNPLPLVEKTQKPVLTAGDGSVSWETVPYAICYVVTVNGKVIAFPTTTSIDGLTKDDIVTVQSVNEYGALSESSEAVTITSATGIKTIDRQDINTNIVAIYTLDGRRVTSLQKGINIVRMNDGRTMKVIK
ncbi:MAG: Ig-like domain-containing protein [Prevotella sp.]|nr:Ig-like domain-containing protein [Prevotella sp.]